MRLVGLGVRRKQRDLSLAVECREGINTRYVSEAGTTELSE